jgi:hypothetical protein
VWHWNCRMKVNKWIGFWNCSDSGVVVMFLLDFKIVPTFYFRNASCALSYTYLIFFLLVDCLEFCKKQSTFIVIRCILKCWAFVVMIVWYFDIQLPVQSVPITTNVVSSNPAHGSCIQYNIGWYRLSVKCDRSLLFYRYSGFLHQ